MKSLIVSLLLFSCAIAQQSNTRSVFIGVNAGLFNIERENFDKTYNSSAGFCPSLTIGIPVSTRSYLYGKVSYFSKSGTPSTFTYAYVDNTPGVTEEIKSGSADFSEWLFNAGFMYNFFLSEDFTLAVNGGLSFVNLNEEIKTSGYSVKNNGGGFLGGFGGISLEKNFTGSHFSAVAEIQYNAAKENISSFMGNYGGLNASVGARYYFKERRLK
jgi:hypothetical protein